MIRGTRDAARLAAVSTALLLCAAPAPASEREASDPPALPARKQPDFDPWAGIDRDGRIPAVEKPADLPNPGRWRYIPEGRLKPGNMLQRFGVSSFIAPFFFRSEDVGWGGGLAIVDIDFRAQRRREFAGIFGSYSEEGQQTYSILWQRWLHHIELPQGGVLQEERTFVRGFAVYSNTLTRRFYGFGADTSDFDQTRYSDEQVALALALQRAWPAPGDDLVLRGGLRGEFHNLGTGLGAPVCQPAGSPGPIPCQTRDVFPALFQEAEEQAMGFLEASATWDTRDSQMNAYGGWHVGASVRAALLQSDWDVGAIYEVGGATSCRCPASSTMAATRTRRTRRPTPWSWPCAPSSARATCPSSSGRASAATTGCEATWPDASPTTPAGSPPASTASGC